MSLIEAKKWRRIQKWGNIGIALFCLMATITYTFNPMPYALILWSIWGMAVVVMVLVILRAAKMEVLSNMNIDINQYEALVIEAQKKEGPR